MPDRPEGVEQAGKAGHREQKDADGVGRHGDDHTPALVPSKGLDAIRLRTLLLVAGAVAGFGCCWRLRVADGLGVVGG